MSSILTNTGAMTALQTLKSINSNLEMTQREIATGKSVGSAKDDAAVFAISKVMEADVAGFEAVSSSLALGQSTVAVASNGAAQVGELLNEIKGKIVSANEENVDRTKIQSEIESLRGQITGIVDSAQFNGLNLLNGTTDGASGFSVLSSLNRDSAGGVTTSSISFDPTDTNLSTSSGTALAVGSAAIGAAVAATEVFNVANINGTSAAHGGAAVGADGVYTTSLDANQGGTPDDDGITIGNFDFATIADDTGGAVAVALDRANDPAATGGLIAGDSISVQVGNVTARYTVSEGDAGADVSAGLRAGLIDAGLDTAAVSATVNGDGNLEIRNLTNAVDDVDGNGGYDISISSSRAAGGLAGLDSIDVSDATGAAAALTDIEGFIQNAVDAQAQLGTTAKRLEIQNDFMSTQIDSFKSGIGSLVDANMEEASARLQALQTQQQLGIQALSIANSAPQNILSLFR